MRNFVVKDKNVKYAGQNVYKAVGSIFPNLTVGNLNKVFRLKDVKVNKVRINKEYILREGDNVEVYLTDEILFNTMSSLEIVYEDENIVVAFKPIHMPSCNESHKYESHEIYMENILRNQTHQNISICHRLDTNTQGLVIFAKNDSAHTELLNAFKNRQITKKYIAFVYGKPLKKQDTLKAYLTKNSKSSTVKVFKNQVKNSEEIITEYVSLDYLVHFNVSVLEVTLHTGKTHQIRAHFSFEGMPIVRRSKVLNTRDKQKV